VSLDCQVLPNHDPSQVLNHVVPVFSLRILESIVAPRINMDDVRPMIHQVLHAFEVSLRSCNAECRSVVVVGGIDVDID